MTRSFTIARFFCGCAYLNPMDTAIFCPEHRHTPHRGYITGRETIKVPEHTPYSMLHVTPHRTIRAFPAILQSDAHNSLHTVTGVSDGHHNDWSIPQADLLGLCAACLIDSEDYNETRIAMCECGNEQCSYRWCGSLQGLHAFWKLHAQGGSEETTGLKEEDIFSHGAYEDHSQEVRDTLDKERTVLQEAAHKITSDLYQTTTKAFSPGRRAKLPPSYLNPWLEQQLRIAVLQPGTTQARNANRTLMNRVLRLHIIGAIPPLQYKGAAPTLQQALFQ